MSCPRWTTAGHHCVAEHCVVAIGRNWLFCWQHWNLVPGYLKKAIHAHYQAQRRFEFAAAVDNAIEVVARAEAA